VNYTNENCVWLHDRKESRLETKELINGVTDWILTYTNDHGINALVVGVSGGLDSAVVARLCERTGVPTIYVAMPMSLQKDSSPRSLHLAGKLHIGAVIGTGLRCIPIGSIVEAYKKMGLGMTSLREGNIRSRVRANILYDIASEYGGIVVGTGNKDEDEIGYFTKGGDGLVDICPLSQIHKSQVREMAKLLNVPQEIIDAKPTAGLWDGQTDEDELGMTYYEVEVVLRFLDGKINNQEAEKLIGNRDRLIVVHNKVSHMRLKNAHKLKYPPVYQPLAD
jgi:NAD+ synthase